MDARNQTGISTPAADGVGSLYEKKPTKRNFGSRSQQQRLSADQAARQGRIVTSALRVFTTTAAAMDFLNSEQPDIGRPLDAAISSEAGFASVETALTSFSPSFS